MKGTDIAFFAMSAIFGIEKPISEKWSDSGANLGTRRFLSKKLASRSLNLPVPTRNKIMTCRKSVAAMIAANPWFAHDQH